MKLQVINMEGKKTDNIEISDNIFSLKPKKNILPAPILLEQLHT